ncbi:MAG: hypothetical protein WCU88_03375 [Elusimicrobiota bacterium]|jgi:hypothetical protein
MPRALAALHLAAALVAQPASASVSVVSHVSLPASAASLAGPAAADDLIAAPASFSLPTMENAPFSAPMLLGGASMLPLSQTRILAQPAANAALRIRSPIQFPILLRKAAGKPAQEYPPHAGALPTLSRTKLLIAPEAFSRLFDGTAAQPAPADAVPMAEETAAAAFAQQLDFVLKSQSRLLGVVQKTLSQNGYLDAGKTDAQRARLIEDAFKAAEDSFQLQGLKLAPTPESFAAAASLFSKMHASLQRIAQAYPKIPFRMNYIFQTAVNGMLAQASKAASFEEALRAADAAAAQALDVSTVEKEFLENKIDLFETLVKMTAAENGVKSVSSPVELTAVYAAGLAKFRAEGRSLAPTDSCFQTALIVAESMTLLMQAVSPLKGVDARVYSQLMESKLVQKWLKKSSQLLSPDQALEFQKEGLSIAQSMPSLAPAAWAQTTIGRLQDALGARLAERHADASALSAADYAQAASEAASRLKSDAQTQAPSPESQAIAAAVIDGLLRIIQAAANAPGASMSMIGNALNSGAGRKWMESAHKASTPEEAQALLPAAEETANSVLALLPIYWAQEMPGRVESRALGLIEERGLDAESLSAADYIALLREAAALLKPVLAAPCAEATEAGFFAAEQHLRILEALAVKTPRLPALLKISSFIVKNFFLPSLRSAQTFDELKTAAQNAAARIIAQSR